MNKRYVKFFPIYGRIYKNNFDKLEKEIKDFVDKDNVKIVSVDFFAKENYNGCIVLYETN